MEAHPGVFAYLDPPMILIVGAAVAGVAAVLAALPASVPVPTAAADGVPNAVGSFASLFRAQDIATAHSVAVALHTHFADLGGAGGAGAAHRIATFSTTPNGLTFF